MIRNHSDRAKVVIKFEDMTSFGGLFHVMDTFSKIGLGKLIESTLGQHGNTGKVFPYSDIQSSVFYSYVVQTPWKTSTRWLLSFPWHHVSFIHVQTQWDVVRRNSRRIMRFTPVKVPTRNTSSIPQKSSINCF